MAQRLVDLGYEIGETPLQVGGKEQVARPRNGPRIALSACRAGCGTRSLIRLLHGTQRDARVKVAREDAGAKLWEGMTQGISLRDGGQDNLREKTHIRDVQDS